MNLGSIPVRGKLFFTSPEHPVPPWSGSNVMCIEVFSPGVKQQRPEVPRLRVVEPYLFFPLCSWHAT
jgi:hypothetical protein